MNFQTFLVISMIFLVGWKVFKFCNIPSFPQKWEFKVPNCGFFYYLVTFLAIVLFCVVNVILWTI